MEMIIPVFCVLLDKLKTANFLTTKNKTKTLNLCG